MEWAALNPMSLLRRAIAAVPAVKWALGLVGVAVASALVRQSLLATKAGSGSQADTVIVLGVMLLFMILLVIFARIARAAPAFLARPAIVFAWFSLILFMSSALLSTTSIFFGWPRSLPELVGQLHSGTTPGTPSVRAVTAADELVIKYMHEVMILRGVFVDINNNPGSREQVRREGTRLAELLGGIREETLNTSRKIIKYEYRGWALSMVARTYPESDGQHRIYYASMALDSLDHALARMETVKQGWARGERFAAEDYEWMTSPESADLNRCLYHRALALAVIAKAGGSHTKEEVRAALALVSEEFLRDYPVSTIPDFRWASASRD